jgi:RNA polymerase sigma-70 factor (ECF subfamily)
MTDNAEQSLIDRAKAGDARAMDQVLAKYERQIYRFGLRMCGNEDDARDVLQETLLSAFKNLSTFRGDAQLSTWLYQVARSFCLKQRRLHEGEPRHHVDVATAEVRKVATTDLEPDGRTHGRQVGEVLQAAMGALKDEFREALVLRDVEGLSTEEAAEVVGIEVGALKTRLHRARMQLKQNLAAVLDDQTTDLGCPELQQELSAYAASEIDQAACAKIEAHLLTCAHCTAACDALKRTVSMCRSLPGGDVPAPVKAAVRQALRQLPLR